VLHARAVGAITIDTSRTLLAVHQTTKTGNFEGHFFKTFSNMLFKIGDPPAA
jgi:hypothetical protein